MNRKDFFKKLGLGALVCVLCAIFMSCEKAESKKDFAGRIFMEQAEQQQYYTTMWLKAANAQDLTLMNVYADSVNMANYCQHRMLEQINIK